MFRIRRRNRRARAMPSEDIQGDEWASYVLLDTYNRDEHGIAYRAQPHGDWAS
jgi:hypothetical protein